MPIERVSVSSSGEQGNVGSGSSSISSDGRFITFLSGANNLVAEDNGNSGDVFVHDRETGRTERVSVSSTGEQANHGYFLGGVSISSDGRFITFTSSASDLVLGDTNGTDDVFVHDRETGRTERVSVSSTGKQANEGGERTASISSDGRFITFTSYADNLVAGDTNEAPDIFVHDRETGRTERVSVSSTGEEGSGYSDGSSISSDGRFITFRSDANNLVAGDTNEGPDVFVHDRETGRTERVSVSSTGEQGEHGYFLGVPSISPDGRFITFWSEADNLVAGDTNGTDDVFVHDRETGRTERVSVSSTGEQGNQGNYGTSLGSPSVSADGRFITFTSFADNLVAGDTNKASDVFVHDRETGRTERVSVSSAGEPESAQSYLSSISSDGRFITFSSEADNLVAGDTNETNDVFVATNPLFDGSTVPEPPASTLANPVSDTDSPYGQWTSSQDLGDENPGYGYHLGSDLNWGTAGKTKSDTPPGDGNQEVYAIYGGSVAAVIDDYGSYGKAALIYHTLADGRQITSVYGHINTSLSIGDSVTAGQQIGTIHPYSASHLHLNIAEGHTLKAARGYTSTAPTIQTGDDGVKFANVSIDGTPVKFLNAIDFLRVYAGGEGPTISGKPVATAVNMEKAAGTAIPLADLFDWSDPDGSDDITAFAVRDRSVGGGYLTKDNIKQVEDKVFDTIPINEISKWKFVPGETGSTDKIGFNAIDKAGHYSASAVATVVSADTAKPDGNEYATRFRHPVGNGDDTPKLDGDSYYVAQVFNQRNTSINSYHLGVDWNGENGGNTDLGNAVYAAGNGTVEKVVSNQGAATTGFGNYVVLKHKLSEPETINGKTVSQVYSLYAHLESVGNIKVGEQIKIGQKIGEIGTSGYSDVAHLHFEITLGEKLPTADDGYNPNGAPSDWVDPVEFINNRNVEVKVPTPPVIPAENKKPSATAKDVEAEAGKAIILSELFKWSDPDGNDDIVSFVVRDRTEGGGYLTKNGNKLTDGELSKEQPISEISKWKFVPGKAGSEDKIGFNVTDKAGSFNESVVATVMVPKTDPKPIDPVQLASPSFQELELAAKLVAYNVSIDGISTLSEYSIESDGIIEAGTFAAYGLTSSTGAPILAVRGTEFNSAGDWAGNADKQAPGYSEAVDAYPDIKKWLTDHPQASIVGHSQGGAQAQMFAAWATRDGIKVDKVYTFNSTGIDSNDSKVFKSENAEEIKHYISSGDLVSLAGEHFIDGKVVLFDFQQFTETVVNPISLITRAHDRGVGATPASFAPLIVPLDHEAIATMTSNQLSDGNFSYLKSGNNFDVQYFSLLTLISSLGSAGAVIGKLLNIPGSLSFPLIGYKLSDREGTEELRLGGVLQSLAKLPSIGSELENLADKALAAMDAVTKWGKDALVIAEWDYHTWKGVMENFTAEIWKSVKDWGSVAIQGISAWTSSEWDKVKNWGSETWQNLKDWTAENFQDTLSKSQAFFDYLEDHGYAGYLKYLPTIGPAASIGSIIFGRDSDAQVIGNDENNVLSSDVRSNTMTGGKGQDNFIGQLKDFVGDTITDFTKTDTITFVKDLIFRDEISNRPGSAYLGIDIDQNGEITASEEIKLEGNFSGGDFMVVHESGDTRVTFETFLPTLQEGQAIKANLVNGINNQDFLKGDGSTDFKVTLADLGYASYDNVVGVYEIDADGNIVDTRILFENANNNKAADTVISDVEAGNSLGFFIVQDAADWLAGLEDADTFSFVNSKEEAANVHNGSDVSLAVNGMAVDEMVFHSFSKSMNEDGLQHVLSGVEEGGEVITIGFEDLTGGGDRDYEDVVFRVELVNDM